MRERKIKQDIACVAFFLLLSSYYFGPLKNMPNHLKKAEVKIEAISSETDKGIQQDEMLNNDTKQDEVKHINFQFEKAESSFLR